MPARLWPPVESCRRQGARRDRHFRARGGKRNSMTAAEREFAVLPLVELDGGAIQVSLLGANGSRISVRLGSAEAVAITGDLIRAARARVGRADWPANAAAVHSALPCPK